MSPVHAPSVLLDGLLFPEGPRWRDGRLWFSEMHQHRVMTVTPEGEPDVVAECFFRPSGLGFLADGSAIVVNMTDKRLMRIAGGALSVYADLGALVSENPNDMVVDASGRAYVSSLGRRGPPDTPRPDHLRPFAPHIVEYFQEAGVANTPETSEIIRVDPDGSAHLAADGVLSPNGMMITPDGGTLIFAETYANRLSAFDIDADGGLANKRVWAEVGSAMPDGICLDAEGAVWVASPYTNEFLRVREGGAIADRIPLPEGKLGVACMLGGEDGRTLFLLTSLRPTRKIVPGRTRGFIETVRVDAPGAGRP